MPTAYDNLQKAADLTDRYLILLKKRNKLEEEFLAHKQKIAEFSKTSNMKTLKSGNILLYVSAKLKTIFPKKGAKSRKIVEDIMRKSKEWKHAITFDVVKLGQVYDKKKLSQSLREKLEPYTKKEERIRIYTKDISK